MSFPNDPVMSRSMSPLRASGSQQPSGLRPCTAARGSVRDARRINSVLGLYATPPSSSCGFRELVLGRVDDARKFARKLSERPLFELSYTLARQANLAGDRVE